jgi:hypothetical protein
MQRAVSPMNHADTMHVLHASNHVLEVFSRESFRQRLDLQTSQSLTVSLLIGASTDEKLRLC